MADVETLNVDQNWPNKEPGGSLQSSCFFPVIVRNVLQILLVIKSFFRIYTSSSYPISSTKECIVYLDSKFQSLDNFQEGFYGQVSYICIIMLNSTAAATF